MITPQSSSAKGSIILPAAYSFSVSVRPARTYARFARYYDAIYHGIVDYDGDVRFIGGVFERFLPRRPRRILDLGCGTGNHDIPLARLGYAVTGIDRSSAMLSLARTKARAAGLRIRFVRAEMQSFRLGSRFDATVCLFGAFGYLLRSREVLRCLGNVRRCLAADGLFVFEFWQRSGVLPPPHRSWTHRKVAEYEIVRLEESRFSSRTGRLPIEFRFFVFQDRRLIDRFDETHVVQTYTIDRVRTLLRRGGFDLVGVYGATNVKKGFRAPPKDSFRVMGVARPRAQS